MHREDAIAIFNLELEHLGFVDYILALSVIIVLLMLIPFMFLCCNYDHQRSKVYIFSKLEPFLTRILFAGLFIAMLKMIDFEREQCEYNKQEVTKFSGTNLCGDEYSRLDTVLVTDNLTKAELTLQQMQYALYFVVGVIIFELICMGCYYILCEKKDSKTSKESSTQ